MENDDLEEKPTAFGIWGVDAFGKIYLAEVQPWDEEEFVWGDACLGHYWAGNVPLYEKRKKPVKHKRTAEDAFRSIASWLGIGGYNDPEFDADKLEKKIREEIERMCRQSKSHINDSLSWYEP